MRVRIIAWNFSFILLASFLPARAEIEPTDTYRIATSDAQPGTFDPAVSYADSFAAHLIQNIYETLILYRGNDTSSPEPSLAELYSLSADGTVFTFNLRRNVAFACLDTDTGTLINYGVLTAHDVKYSLDRAVLYRARGGPSWMFGPAGAELKSAQDYALSSHNQAAMKEYVESGGVKVVDDFTLTVEVESGSSLLLPILATSVGGVYSREWALGHPQPGAVYLGISYRGDENSYVKSNTCGTGPYFLAEWSSDGRIVLERNDDWWRVKEGLEPLPRLKTIIYAPTADDGERVQMLLRGDVDTASVSIRGLNDVAVGDDVSRPSEGLQVFRFPTFDVETLHMSMMRAPMNDSRVRDAMRYAFDYETYITSATHNTARRLFSPLPEGMPCYVGVGDPLLKTYDFDVDHARRLLLSAGYSSSSRLRVVVGYVAEDELWKSSATILADALSGMVDANGDPMVEIVLEGVLRDEFVERVFYVEDPREVPYDIYSFGWTPDYVHPQNYVDIYGASYGDFAYYTGWKDDETDAALKLAKEEPLSLACPRYQAAAREVAEQGPFVFVAQLDGLAWQRDWVRGYSPQGAGPLQSSFARGTSAYGFFYSMSKELPTTTTTTSPTTTVPTPSPVSSVPSTLLATLTTASSLWLAISCRRRPNARGERESQRA